MARDAMGKLAEADELDKHSIRLKVKDAASSVALHELAIGKRRSAIKQLRRRPKRKRSDRTVL